MPDLDDEEDDDGEPVEDVVDDGAGEGAAELGPVAHLRDGHDRVRHGGPDVGAHHHRNSRSARDIVIRRSGLLGLFSPSGKYSISGKEMLMQSNHNSVKTKGKSPVKWPNHPSGLSLF